MIGLGMTGLAIAGVLIYSQAGAQVVRPILQPIRFSYAAKFICGVQRGVGLENSSHESSDGQVIKEPPVKRGNYATAVNIHNPQTGRVKIAKKVVLALPEPDQGKPSDKVSHVLESDGAMEVDCQEIDRLLGQSSGQLFKKGFLVVESTTELDVVGVYTANTDMTSTLTGNQAQGMTMDVEYIPGRRIIAGLTPPTIGIGDLP